MPKKRFTPIASVQVSEARAPEAIALLNEYASLRSEPAQKSLIEFLREMLPHSIAELRKKVKVPAA